MLQHHLQVTRHQESPTEPVSWDDSCQRDLRWWSDVSHLVVGIDLAASLYPCIRCGVGRVSRLRPPVRLVVFRCFSIFNQPLRASGSLPCHPGFSPSSPGQVSVSLHRQYVRSFIPPQGRGHSFLNTQLRGSGNSSPLRIQQCASAPPVCPGSPQRFSRLSQPGWPDPRFRVDSPHGCVTVDLFVTSLNHRLQVYFSPMADPQAAAADALIQSWDHLQAYAFPSYGLIQRVLSKVQGSHNLELTLVLPFGHYGLGFRTSSTFWWRSLSFCLNVGIFSVSPTSISNTGASAR